MATQRWAHLAGRQVFGFPFQTKTPFRMMDLPHGTYVLTDRDICVMERALTGRGGEPDVTEIGRILWREYGMAGPERYNASWRAVIDCLSSLSRTERPVEDDLPAEAKALALLIKHPEWPDNRIASEIGISRTSLYRFENFCKAREAMTEAGRKEAIDRHKRKSV